MPTDIAGSANLEMVQHTLETVVRKIRAIISDSHGMRQALYFRLLRITQYLAWKFPTYGALQQLLEDIGNLKITGTQIGKQETQVTLIPYTSKPFESHSNSEFEKAWNRKFLFTYRKKFSKPIINSSGEKFFSDQGWGCYIRVFQMMLAQCYQVIHFDESDGKNSDESREREFIKELFTDSDKSLLSVHNFCKVGMQAFNRQPGTWFGPTSAAKVSEIILGDVHNSKSASHKYYFAKQLKICTFDELIDPDLVKEQLSGAHSGVVILYCKKLGPHQSVAPEYTEAIKQLFKLPSFMGFASGDSATSAHYFVASSDSGMYYLDPHVETRPALDGAEMDTNTWHALHNESTGKPCLFQLNINQVNASCCFCFLIRSEDELANLCLELEMYDALHEAFEVKRGGFMDNLTHDLDVNKWKTDEDDEDLVVL